MSQEAPKLNPKDPLKQAKINILFTEWLRKAAPELGLDPHKLILGDVLSSIIGDDANCFGIKGAGFMPDLVDNMRESLFAIMDWEINIPETPDNLRKRLREVKFALEKLDWHNQAEFYRARNTWTVKVRDYTRHEVNTNNDLREAEMYRIDMNEIINEAWEKFFYGE